MLLSLTIAKLIFQLNGSDAHPLAFLLRERSRSQPSCDVCFCSDLLSHSFFPPLSTDLYMPPRGKGRGRGGASSAATRAQARSMDEYFPSVYGDRWPALKAAMHQEPPKIALYNRFCQLPFKEVIPEGVLVRVDPESMSQAFCPVGKKAAAEGSGDEEHSAALIAKPPIDEFNVRGYYLMDYASALVVDQLQVGQFDKVLDVCAAPGGKSIAIAQFLSPDAELVANEHNGERCARLRRNLLDHVPVNYVPWRVTQRNAETWHDPCAYDRVLVDAPCSSERHLLVQSRGMPVDSRLWTELTSRQLAVTQRSLLQRALETCREGGRVVYSTCSISPFENDGVVREALRRTRCEIEVVKPTYTRLGEPTEYGWILLPDVAEGWGPIFFCVLHKIKHERVHDGSSSDDD